MKITFRGFDLAARVVGWLKPDDSIVPAWEVISHDASQHGPDRITLLGWSATQTPYAIGSEYPGLANGPWIVVGFTERPVADVWQIVMDVEQRKH